VWGRGGGGGRGGRGSRREVEVEGEGDCGEQENLAESETLSHPEKTRGGAKGQ